MNSRIFISYRRQDSAGQAGRLYDRLSARFGRANVFMDVDTIRSGMDFTQAIDEAVSSCDVFLAVIGKDWVEMMGPGGGRRIDDPRDFVRLEIETALRRSVVVVPVLVRGSTIPTEDDLPEEIAELARHEAIELNDSRFDYDVGHLIAELEEILGEPSAEPPPGLLRKAVRSARRPRNAAALAVAVGILVTVIVLVTRGPAAIDENIAFLSDRTGNTEIFATNIGGTPWKQLTTGQSHQVRAEPAPGEEAIVNASEFRPDWSPDGKRIVFASEHDGPRDLYFMNANGTGLTRITSGDASEAAPDWHPFDNRIAYFVYSGESTEDEPHSAIWVVNQDGTNPTRLTTDAYLNKGPDWSPDGKHIAYVSNVDGDPDIFVMDADGSHKQQLTYTESVEFQPTWSPDGKMIAFEGEEGDDLEIFVMNRDGSARTNLTSNGAHDQLPTWSPDGQHIAYGSNLEGNFEIYVMSAEGSNARNVTQSAAQDSAPAWRPESQT